MLAIIQASSATMPRHNGVVRGRSGSVPGAPQPKQRRSLVLAYCRNPLQVGSLQLDRLSPVGIPYHCYKLWCSYVGYGSILEATHLQTTHLKTALVLEAFC